MNTKESQTLNKHRWVNEPAEKICVEEWRKLCSLASCANYNQHLEGVLSPNQPKMEMISERDEQVAESVIQWLGSPVGMEFIGRIINRSGEFRSYLGVGLRK